MVWPGFTVAPDAGSDDFATASPGMPGVWVVVQSSSEPVTQFDGTFGLSGLFGLVPSPVT